MGDYKPKVLLIDIETSPDRGYFFGKPYEANILEVDEHWMILSMAYQWYGQKKIYCKTLVDYPGYKKRGDEKLVRDIWKLCEEADVIVAQNGNRFDLKKIRTRYLLHRLDPPKRYKTVDTLLILRSEFGFTSNRLDYVMKQMGYEGKVPTTGKHLWLSCLKWDLPSWGRMRRYNKRDVELLGWLYERIAPFAKPAAMPNLTLLTGKMACTFCGSERLRKKGFDRVLASEFQRYQCMNCGKWLRGMNQRVPAVKIRSL